MKTPSQGLIVCKDCGRSAEPHKKLKNRCDPCARAKAIAYTAAYRDRHKADPVELVCKDCGKAFTTARTGRKWKCPECLTRYTVEYKRKHAEASRQSTRRFRERHKERLKVYLVERRKQKISEMTPDELAEFRKKESDKSKRFMRELREQVFSAYGGPVCACCGETTEQFLSIDHVNNDGAQMRRDGVHSKGGNAFYQWLRKNKFPDGFQVLCMNCNVGKYRNGGVCPHQARCND